MKTFEDKHGNQSSMRKVFIGLVVYAMLMGSYVVVNEGSVLGLAFISGIVALAGGLKLGQNSQENK